MEVFLYINKFHQFISSAEFSTLSNKLAPNFTFFKFVTQLLFGTSKRFEVFSNAFGTGKKGVAVRRQLQ